MKKTINVNIGNMAFTLDEDAFGALKRYLADIRSRLGEAESKEIIEDVEARIADIFSEQVARGGVVTIEMVRGAISVIGRAEVFGEPKKTVVIEEVPVREGQPRKLYRRRDGAVIGGVCGGIADYFDIDATIVRLVTFLLVFLAGLSLWVYIIFWIFIPIEPRPTYRDRYYERRDGR